MARSSARKYLVGRRAASKKVLKIESLENRLVLASPQPDSYDVIEDQTFTTGIQVVFDSTAVIPRAVAGSLGAPGWRSFDDLNTTAYPTMQGDPVTPWWSYFYDPDAPQSYGTWDAPRQAPFESGTVDGLSPSSTIDAPSGTDPGALFRKEFTLTAAQAASTHARFNLLCDDGCVVYLNDVELFRQGEVPAGPRTVPGYTGGAASSETAYVQTTVDLGDLGVPLLSDDVNKIAVELINNNNGSTDLGFDLEMILGTQTGTAPGVADNDAPAGAFTVTKLTDPVSGGNPAGTVTMNPDGTFTYMPAAEFSGTATFTYEITDTAGTAGPVTVTLNVASVDDIPIARPDFYAGPQGEPIVITQTTAPPAYLAAGSLWAYSDDETDQDSLNPDWKGPPSANFDPIGAGWLTGNAPFGNVDQPITTTITYVAPATYYFWTLMDITGPIPNTLALSLRRDDCAVVYINGVEAYRSGTGGQATLPAGHNFQTLCTGAAVGGADEAAYFDAVIDATGLNLQPSGNTVAVEVHQLGTGSTDISFDMAISSASVGLLANDTDAEGATLTAVIEDASQLDANGTFTPNDDGTFTFDPDDGFAGTLTFTYHATDGTTNSNTVTSSITIVADPDSPVANADAYTVAQGSSLVTDATSVTYLARGSAGWSYLDEMTNGQDPDGPDPDPLPPTPTEQYPLDAQGDAWYENDFDTASSDAGIGAWKTGAGPLGAGGLDGGAEPDIVLGTTVAGNDVATGTAPANEFNTVTTYLFRRLVSIPDGASRDQLSIEILADDGGILRVNGTEVLRIDMPANPIDSTTLATGALSEAYRSFNIDVSNLLVNGDNLFAFELHQSSLTSSDVGFDLAVKNTVGVLANDTDPTSDPLSAVLGTGPTNAAAFTLNPNGTFTYTPNPSFSGTDTFTYRASDGTHESQLATVTITVTPTSTCSNDADLNDDSVVNGGDLALLVQNYGLTTGATPAQGDINCDGAIGLLDLHELQIRLTPSPSPGAASAVVATAPVSTPAVDRVVAGLDRAIERVRPRAPLAAARLEQVRERVQQNATGPARPSESAETARATGLRASRVARAARAHSQAIQDLFG